jgi:hypothetical protein
MNLIIVLSDKFTRLYQFLSSINIPSMTAATCSVWQLELSCLSAADIVFAAASRHYPVWQLPTLYLQLPANSCHYPVWQLPADSCHYPVWQLPADSCHYPGWQLPADSCHYLVWQLLADSCHYPVWQLPILYCSCQILPRQLIKIWNKAQHEC